MGSDISKTKIDRLGDRLRKGDITEPNLRLLDEYRRSFNTAYEVVAGSIRRQLNLEPTGRPAKSTTSIAEKLSRESIRLTQIQDIAGCRLVVSAIADQQRVVTALAELFPDSIIMDRKEHPSHGYRAVHVIARSEGKLVEIQVRTALQQLWAELSEKLSDRVDPAIKYGGGEEPIKRLLRDTSSMVAGIEDLEIGVLELRERVKKILPDQSSTSELTLQKRQAIMDLQERIDTIQSSVMTQRQRALKVLQRAVYELFPSEGQENVFFN
jgi:putative GTP pyrophosphokinase